MPAVWRHRNANGPVIRATSIKDNWKRKREGKNFGNCDKFSFTRNHNVFASKSQHNPLFLSCDMPLDIVFYIQLNLC
jgi:hypothetical protein